MTAATPPPPAAKPPLEPRLRRPPAPRNDSGSCTRLATARVNPGTGEAPLLTGVQGALALDLAPAPSGPHLPELALVPGPDESDEPTEELRVWAARFAQAVVEVVGGDRPVTQLLRWTAPRVYEDLSRRVRVLGQTRTAGQRRRALRPQVRSVHVCRPGPASAEVSVHVRYGERSRALAARLERRQGRWTCTALQLG